MDLPLEEAIVNSAKGQLKDCEMVKELLKTRSLLEQDVIKMVQHGATIHDIRRRFGKETAAKAPAMLAKIREEIGAKLEEMLARGMTREEIIEELRPHTDISPTDPTSLVSDPSPLPNAPDGQQPPPDHTGKPRPRRSARESREATPVSIPAPEEAAQEGGESGTQGKPPKQRKARERKPKVTPSPPPTDSDFPELFSEGAVRQISLSAYERDPKARRACLAHHGVRCAVCGFDFAENYGELGEGYINVHHLRPLSEIGEKYEVNPVTDLIPVCPNCHAMLHRQAPPLAPEAVRKTIRRKSEPKRENELPAARKRQPPQSEKAVPKQKRTASKKPKGKSSAQ